MTKAEALEIVRDIERCIEESLRDPDIANRSDDFKAGYRQGFAEGIAASLAARSKPELK